MSEERKMEESQIFKEVQDLLNDCSSGATFISFKGQAIINVVQIKYIEPDHIKMLCSSEELADGDFFIEVYQSDKIRHKMRLSNLLDALKEAQERRRDLYKKNSDSTIERKRR